MKEVTIYMLEAIVCSGALLAVYAVLLEGRVKFRWCRLYLLLTTLMAALIPLLRIPVWPGKVIEATPQVTAGIPEQWGAEVLPDAEPMVTTANFCLGLYVLGVSLIVGVMIWQIVRMHLLRRTAKITRGKDYTLARTLPQIASFSFLHTIYVWDKTPVEEMAAIIAHESSHIAHRHSIERIAMELMKAALWWNPFVWIAARRLTETEEFEADSDVLNSGYDRSAYMQTIFKQLFGYSPEIANGLRNSLTKKRFKMMTKQSNSRHNLLRLAGTLPALVGLLCAFSFTSRAAVITVPAAQTENAAEPETTGAAQTGEQTCQVTVTVQDENQHVIPGAAIQVVGGKKGSITNAEGRAVLSVPGGSKLAISYPGYETENLEASGSSMIVVVTLQAEKKQGSTPSGNNSEAYRPSPSTPAADVGKPLYIIGGVETEDGLERVDPNRIKQIAVIKADKAVAKYGQKGRNGAIIVTLKEIGEMAPQTTGQSGTGSDEQILDISSASKSTDEASHEGVFLIAETMPQFVVPGSEKEGSLNDFRAWAQKQVKYPAEAFNKGIQGRVVVSFVIEQDGSVSQVTKLESPDDSLWEEVRRVIASSPRWKPGVQRGKTVRVKFTLPIDFKSSPAEKSVATNDKEPFLIAETMPTFENGDIAEFRKWVQMRVKYPAEALKKNIHGRVVVSFVVETDGSVSTIETIRSPHKSLTDEVRRIIASSPKWTPGSQRGKTVRVKFTLPVDFAVSTGEGIVQEKAGEKQAGEMDEIVVVGYGS
ncbi:M56 family metallopeptidase [uncultured Alistipes sp.]|uniref:M56 family metallopeptidase n=1 Tax=uncultured Alistipes sp. TaxID=538949 RepID=UPI0025EE067D|nr:M56 family metallopeptidase [uncultured Alistipes sp.]